MDSYSLGIIAAFSTVICWALGTISFSAAARLIAPDLLNKSRIWLAMLLLSIFIPLLYQQNPLRLFTEVSAEHWAWLALSGLVGLSIGDYFLFESYRILGARRGSLFTTVSPAATLLSAIILLDESMDLTGLAGMIVTIGGIAWLLSSREEQAEVKQDNYGHYWRGIWMGIAAAFCQGLGLVLAKKGMVQNGVQSISAAEAAWLRLLCAFIFLFIFDLFRSKNTRFIRAAFLHPGAFKYILAGTMLGPVIGISLSLYAATHIEVSMAQTILSLVPVAVLPISAILYKHKINLRMIAASLIALLGVCILIWRVRLLELFQV